ncbi:MAG: response regulator [Acidimicrobiia bacterium]|nr:response regulator [Acidimicrobiia bacterium]
MLSSVLVVDDEAHARDDLVDLLKESGRVKWVEVSANAEEALVALQKSKYDAVFLDIRMPGLDGLQLAATIGQFSHPPRIVFVSAYDVHAVSAFEVEAVDYLVKPVGSDRLAACLDRVISRSSDRTDNGEKPPSGTDLPFVGVELAGKTTLIERSEIRYVEAQGDYVRLHAQSGSYLVRRPLSWLSERWEDHGFVRVHRSYLVNLRHVSEISPFFNGTLQIRVKDQEGTSLPVSRRRARHLRDRLGITGS